MSATLLSIMPEYRGLSHMRRSRTVDEARGEVLLGDEVSLDGVEEFLLFVVVLEFF